MSRPFTYAPLPIGTFRLLKFAGEIGPEHHIQCFLENVFLDDEPDYDALSYAWNGERPAMSINCNGQCLLVTPSLLQALVILQRFRHTRPIWIDAICIDQSDFLDKERQVPMMGDYYSKANTVVLWLGQSGNYTSLLPERIRGLLESLQTLSGPILASKTVLESHKLPARDDHIWCAIGDLFSRTWFQRLWTVQEVALAQKILVFCGEAQLEWNQIASLAHGVTLAGLMNLCRAFEDVDTSRTDGFSGAMFPDFIAQERNKQKAYPLTSALHFARSRDTSEPVDKVYAVLGLIDEKVCNQIKVDYSEKARAEYWKVYIHAVSIALRVRPDLDTILIEASSQDRPEKLPSWCPNYNSRLKGFAFPYIFFSAGGSSMQSPSHSASFSISDDMKQLSVQAIQVDTVTQTVPGTWNWYVNAAMQEGPDGCAAKGFAWMNECLHLSQQIFKQEGGIPESLVRTLIADVLHVPSTPSPDRQLLYKSVFPATIYLQALRDAPQFASRAIADEEKLLAQRYLNAMNMVCGGRRFFATKEGRIGIASAETSAGDVVCVFRNSRLPFVLRPVQNGEIYELVSEAYIHGIMHGEVLKQAKSEPFWDWFTLV